MLFGDLLMLFACSVNTVAATMATGFQPALLDWICGHSKAKRLEVVCALYSKTVRQIFFVDIDSQTDALCSRRLFPMLSAWIEARRYAADV
jgi:hypothetical protein